jgi:hypothetical protein
MSAGEQFHAYGRVHVDPHVAAGAVRAVHLRWKRGQLGDADAVEVLRALGLAPSGSGGRFTPTGRRDTRTEGKRRLRAAETAASVRTLPDLPEHVAGRSADEGSSTTGQPRSDGGTT